MSRNLLWAMCFTISVLGAVRTAPAQTPKRGIAKPFASVKFEPDEDVKCLSSAIEAGDPIAGGSTFILKAPPKCLVPWHYHTAEEQLIVIHGTVLTEMEGNSPTILGPGGFAMMPSKENHQFSCQSKDECLIVVTFDRAYDIYWVKGSKYLLQR